MGDGGTAPPPRAAPTVNTALCCGETAMAASVHCTEYSWEPALVEPMRRGGPHRVQLPTLDREKSPPSPVLCTPRPGWCTHSTDTAPEAHTEMMAIGRTTSIRPCGCEPHHCSRQKLISGTAEEVPRRRSRVLTCSRGRRRDHQQQERIPRGSHAEVGWFNYRGQIGPGPDRRR